MTSTNKFFVFIFALSVILLLPSLFEFFYFKNLNSNSTNFKDNLPELNILKDEKFSILFVGDIMLDRTIRKDGEAQGYEELFSCLTNEFSKYDYVIGNLEGTITDYESVSKNAEYLSPSSFRFTFDKNAVKALVDIGLSAVSIGNNHIKDFGNEGIEQTVQKAEELKLITFGDPREGRVRYKILNIKDTNIALIPYNQFFGTTEQTLEDLFNTQKNSDIQIVYTHWGNEYVEANQVTKSLARNFVDSGADLIVGTHPHVIQESEIYKNVNIYYSLGNFIFDQYWEESVRKGLTLSVTFDNKKIISIEEKIIESKRNAGTCFKNAPLP